MGLSLLKKIDMGVDISILVLTLFRLDINKTWTFENIIIFLKKLFILAEIKQAEADDIQWLFSFPKQLIITTYINKYTEFELCNSRCIWYEEFKKNPEYIILYFHGGGFCSCSPEIYYGLLSNIKNKITNRKKINYLLIDYPKAPEFKYPTAINICYQIYVQILSLFPNTSFIFMGDSAGGNLLLHVTNKIIQNNIKRPINLICLSPWIITNIRDKYWKQNLDKDYLTPYSINFVTKIYLGEENLINRSDNSILDFNFANFPPILVRAGTNELILDEIIAFVNKVKECNKKIEFQLIDNMPHSFDALNALISNNDSKFDLLINYINNILS